MFRGKIKAKMTPMTRRCTQSTTQFNNNSSSIPISFSHQCRKKSFCASQQLQFVFGALKKKLHHIRDVSGLTIYLLICKTDLKETVVSRPHHNGTPLPWRGASYAIWQHKGEVLGEGRRQDLHSWFTHSLIG